VSWFRELLGVAISGLTARKVRTVLIMLGPILGAAGIVAAVGLNESAKGNVRETLERLGTNLIVVNADGTFTGGEAPTLPADATDRARNVSTVDRVVGLTEIGGLQVLPSQGGREFFQTVPVPLLTSELNLLDVLDVDMLHGRFLNGSDEDNKLRVAILGEDLADDYQYLAGEERTVSVDGVAYAVVGVLRSADLVPDLDTAVIIPKSTAERDFDIEQKPTILYVRADDGAVDTTADALPVAVNLGGPESVSVVVPSDLLEAQAEVDTTLRNVLFLMGGLALLVGGVGIANVMSISVIQRSGEIGIRRALGHNKAKIAMQFLLEALFIGVLGAVVGVATGVGVIYLVSAILDWVATLNMPLFIMAGAMALAVSIVAGLYPAWKAARLEPLETLRLG
jgi:putative ABC transport system permease protein